MQQILCDALQGAGTGMELCMWATLCVLYFFVFVYCGQSWSGIRKFLLRTMIDNPVARLLNEQRWAYPSLCIGAAFTLYSALRYLAIATGLWAPLDEGLAIELLVVYQRRALLGIANVAIGPLLYSLNDTLGGDPESLFKLEHERMAKKVATFKPSVPMATFLDVHMKVFDWIVSPQLFKLENIPDKPALFVGNHAIVGVDMPLLIAHVYKKKGIFLRGLADTFHFDLPVWGQLLTAAGAVVGTRPTCHALMEAGENVLVYPGGAHEVLKKVNDDVYELKWKNRVGFAKMAIDHGYTIVPVATVGTNEMLEVVYDVPMGWLFGGKRGDISAPVLKPPSLSQLQRVYFSFGEPIDTSTFAGCASQENAETVRDLTKASLEEEIRWLRDVSEKDPERSSVERVANAVRAKVGQLVGKKND